MPTEIGCRNCSLRFSVGWFHYHDFASGYGSQTLLVCTNCGTQHSIEIALRDRGPEHFEYRDVILTSASNNARVPALKLIRTALSCTPTEARERLDNAPVRLTQRLSPYQIEEWRRNNDTTGLSIEYPVVDVEPNTHYGPIKNDRLLGAATPQMKRNSVDLQEMPVSQPLTDDGEIDLAVQRCSNCSAVGTLVGQFDVASPCPNCKQSTLRELSSWIT